MNIGGIGSSPSSAPAVGSGGSSSEVDSLKQQKSKLENELKQLKGSPEAKSEKAQKKMKELQKQINQLDQKIAELQTKKSDDKNSAKGAASADEGAVRRNFDVYEKSGE